jgi:hypothetical protein
MNDDYDYSVQFNSVLIYLRATLTVQRPITKREGAKKRNKIQTKYKNKVTYNLNNNNNNSIQFFIICVPSQQPQGQLQAQHSVDTDNYIMDKHNIKSKTS